MSVPAIVAQGTGNTKGTAFTSAYSPQANASAFGTTSYSSTSQTALASALSFPNFRPPGLLPAVIGLCLLVAGVAAGSGGPFGMAVTVLTPVSLPLIAVLSRLRGPMASCLLFIVGGGTLFVLLMMTTTMSFSPYADAAEMDNALTMMMVAGPVLGIALMAWYGYRRVRFHRSAPVRAKAWTMWSRMAYCRRDNIVFDPVTGASGPPAATRSIVMNQP